MVLDRKAVTCPHAGSKAGMRFKSRDLPHFTYRRCGDIPDATIFTPPIPACWCPYVPGVLMCPVPLCAHTPKLCCEQRAQATQQCISMKKERQQKKVVDPVLRRTASQGETTMRLNYKRGKGLQQRMLSTIQQQQPRYNKTQAL